MLKKRFTTQKFSDKFMLAGDERFSYAPGEKWTCGLGKASYTPTIMTANILHCRI